jgi:hypothetical protein
MFLYGSASKQFRVISFDQFYVPPRQQNEEFHTGPILLLSTR